jgi:transmembrane sensor
MSVKFMQLPDQINQQAAEWFTRLQSAHLSEKDRQEFNYWLSEHDDHRKAYRQIELVWQCLGDISSSDEGTALALSVKSFSIRLRSYFLAPAAMLKGLFASPKYAMGFAVAFVAVGLLLSGSNKPVTTHYSTQTGEIKTIVLADNSEITLGAKSQISTRISDETRSVDLISGEAFFNVAKDRQKPFFVKVNNVSVEVVGTQFNVQKIRDAVSVAVLEGIVNVFEQSKEDILLKSTPDVVLTAGQRVVKAADQAFEAVTVVPSSDLGAWRLGRLIYSDISLVDVVTDAGRYFEGEIRLQSKDLADVKVTMTLRTDQVAQLPQMLAQTLPLEVHGTPDNIILLKK